MATQIEPAFVLTNQTNRSHAILRIYAAITLPLLCNFIEQSIVGVIVNDILQDLGHGDTQSWVGASYLLASAVVSPLCGRLSDVFSRRAALLLSLAVFCFSSLGCALSRNMAQLLVFRTFQGLGGGSIYIACFTVVADCVPVHLQGRYTGLIEVNSAIVNGLAPLVGGLIVSHASWRWAFGMIVPASVLGAMWALWLIPTTITKGSFKQKLFALDYVGVLLLCAACVALMLPLNWGGAAYTWTSTPVLVPLALFLPTVACFILWEGRFPLPVMPLSLYRHRVIAVSGLVSVPSGVGWFVELFTVPQLLQLFRRSSPVQSGLLLMPYIVAFVAAAIVGGLVISRWRSYRGVMVFGLAGWSIASGLMSTVTRTTPLGIIILWQLAGGFGTGLAYISTVLAVQATAGWELVAVASGFRNLARLIGGAIGLAAAAAVTNNCLRNALADSALDESTIRSIANNPISVLDRASEDAVFDAVLEGFHRGSRIIFIAIAIMTCLAGIVAAFGVPANVIVAEDAPSPAQNGADDGEEKLPEVVA